MDFLQKIVSGGQTGVDRAALDAAMACGLPVGGWCPKGRRAEDGVIDARYPLRETPGRAYRQRTTWNVRDSDATLVLTMDAEASGGTAFTQEVAERLGRPLCSVQLRTPHALPVIRAWIAAEKVAVLNVAGPREETAPGVYALAYALLIDCFCTPRVG